jgi:phosphotransacetylase
VLSRKPFICPPDLLRRASDRPAVRTAIAAAAAPLPLVSVRAATEAGLIDPVLVGDRMTIRRLAREMEWDIASFDIDDQDDETSAATRAAQIAGAGEAGVLMKGHIHTDIFVRAVLRRENGLLDRPRLTHSFHMTVPDSRAALIISDAAVNVHPDIETKRHIIQNAVELAQALGNSRPRVALLSGTEEVSAAMPSSQEADELTRWAASSVPDAEVYGPLAFDNAISIEAARIKGIEHPVAGNADILVVPNIETGNALFKMMVYFMSACAAGIMSGAKVPIILTSRADPPEARLAAAAIAALQADG